MKLITRDMLARDLAEKCNFYLYNTKALLAAMDEVVTSYFDAVTDDEEVTVQLLEGLKISAKVVPERERVDPRTYTPVTCAATIKPWARFSSGFRDTIQQQYDNKKENKDT